MFNPNTELPDFEAQQAEVARLQQMAQLLRKQGTAQPEMQMVSGRAVKPHWLQRLVPVLNQFQAGQADRQAAERAQDISNQQSQLANKWRAGLPQPTPAVPRAEDIMGNTSVMPEDAKPVDRQSVLKYTLQGLANPRTAKEAALVHQTLNSDINRQEDMQFKDKELKVQQQFRAQEAELARQAAAGRAKDQDQFRRDQLEQQAVLRREQLQFQKEQLERLMEDRNLTRKQQALLAQMHAGNTRAIAEMNNQARLDQIAAKKAAEDGAKGEKDVQRNVEKLSKRAEDIAPMREAAAAIQEMLDAAQVGPDGKIKDIPGLGVTASLHPYLRSAEGNVNRQKIVKFANAVLRAQAGLAQTLSEQQKVELETLASGKFTQKEFMKAWPNTLGKLNTQLANLRASYPEDVQLEYSRRGGPRLDDIKPRERTVLPKSTGRGTPMATTQSPGSSLSNKSKTTAPANTSLTSNAQTSLTPAEAAELEDLRKRFPRGN